MFWGKVLVVRRMYARYPAFFFGDEYKGEVELQLLQLMWLTSLRARDLSAFHFTR